MDLNEVSKASIEILKELLIENIEQPY